MIEGKESSEIIEGEQQDEDNICKCSKKVEDEVCETCLKWYHYKCRNITRRKLKKGESYKCKECENNELIGKEERNRNDQEENIEKDKEQEQDDVVEQEEEEENIVEEKEQEQEVGVNREINEDSETEEVELTIGEYKNKIKVMIAREKENEIKWIEKINHALEEKDKTIEQMEETIKLVEHQKEEIRKANSDDAKVKDKEIKKLKEEVINYKLKY